MNNNYTVAKFWKCALQVNPSGYIAYRGKMPTLTEDEYNKQLVDVCKEENIKIIGLADHGNVDAVDSIRTLMNVSDIIVFPGFEISSSEKIHFVCLFSEDTTKDQLNRYLGNLELTDPSDGVRPSSLSAEQLIRKVDELGGFIYAAHSTGDSGILKQKANHVWKNSLLKAAQIPGKVEDAGNFKNILLNKETDYIRLNPIALINAKDVAVPEDLKDQSASCLIKMTTPSFQAFKAAFVDPQARIRLNYNNQEHFYSKINNISISGGFLDGISILFSEHLNTIIGGRGTGKSTLLECIRYVLEKKPVGREAIKKHDEIIRENLGKEKGKIELKVKSSVKNGRVFTISRRYGEPVIIKDDDGNVSVFSTDDIVPQIEIFGQNEILEIADNQDLLFSLLQRFMPEDFQKLSQNISEAEKKISDNSDKLLKAKEALFDVQDKVARLPKLQEEVKQYPKDGLEKLNIIPLIERERGLIDRAEEEYLRIEDSLKYFNDNLPDTAFLGDTALVDLPHKEQLLKIRKDIDICKNTVSKFLASIQSDFEKYFSDFSSLKQLCMKLIEAEEQEIEKSFKKLPSLEGKSGREIGLSYQKLLKNIEQLKPFESKLKVYEKTIDALIKERNNLLAELSDIRSKRSEHLNRSIKSLNKKLSGKLKVILIPEGDLSSLKKFLLGCNLDGVGEKRLSWVDSAVDLTPFSLVRLIRDGKDSLVSSGWGITPSVAESFSKMQYSDILELEALPMPDKISIELNISHNTENFRKIENLSTGQKCTAILHLLLLENKDPLIMDQPEDNLDNAFIAERIVSELRASKIERQFIFATHNANIPVFGDAEWIGILESDSSGANLPVEHQGSIDSPAVRDKAAEILEGGKEAFLQRKEKYGYE